MTSLSRTFSALSRASVEFPEVAPYVNNPDPVSEKLEPPLEEKAVPDYGHFAREPLQRDGTELSTVTSTHTVVGDAEGQAPRIEYVEPGWRGWLNVAGAVVANMLCYGMTQSFGVFQEYYETHLGVSSMAISWIGAIQFALCPALGAAAGPLFDAGYLKPLIIVGGTLYVFCLMMTSIATEYYQILLAHGIGVGLSMGIFFSPSVATISQHFARSRHRNLAFGMQASGSAIAGIYFPISLNYLLPSVGFGWTMRILGFIVLLFMIFIYFTLSATEPPRKKLAILSPVVYKNRAYSVYVLGGCFGSLAIYAPFTFSVTYATMRGVPTSLANYAPAIANGVSIIGRLVPPIFAQKLGPINILMVFTISSGIMELCWTLARNTAGIMAFNAVFGIISGGYGACLNPGAASFAPATNQAGLYLGMFFFTTAFFWLAGTPITATLIDRYPSYLPASVWCGLAVLASGTLFTISRFMKVKQEGTPWV